MTQDLAIIILAAGRGTRMKSDLPKVLHKLAGRPMIGWLLERVGKLTPARTIVVTGPDMDDLRAAVAPAECVIQEKQMGTADAVKPALAALDGFEGRVLILLGDEPLLDAAVLEMMVAHDGPAVMAVEPPDNTGLGRMVTDENNGLKKIVEEKDADEATKKIRLCNAGNFCLDAQDLRRWLPQIENNNAQNEFYLVDLPLIAARDDKAFTVFSMPCPDRWGVNSRAELAAHERVVQQELRMHHMMAGVTMIDPESVMFSHDTYIAPDVTIEPNVFFGEGVRVESGVTIHAFSYLEGCLLKANCSVGPYARIRPKSEIGESASVGNFIEVNRSIVKDGAKAKHVSYLGDAIIGEKSNIGAGTVIANYDGYFKSETILGEGVFTGSNTTLIAPLNIGSGAILAAGSAITKDVPANAIALARSVQENKEGAAENYREKKKGKQ